MREIHDPTGLPQFYAVLAAVILLGAALAWAARRHRGQPFAPFWASVLEHPGETWFLLMTIWSAVGWCALWVGGSRPSWDH